MIRKLIRKSINVVTKNELANDIDEDLDLESSETCSSPTSSINENHKSPKDIDDNRSDFNDSELGSDDTFSVNDEHLEGNCQVDIGEIENIGENDDDFDHIKSNIGEKTRGLFGWRSHNNTSNIPSIEHDPLLYIKNNLNLLNLGKKIFSTEMACKRDEERSIKKWNREQRPILMNEIKQYELDCNELRAFIDKEIDKGLDQISVYERKLNDKEQLMEAVKRKYHLPRSEIVLGNGGVYVGLDDLWIENISGLFQFELIPFSRNTSNSKYNEFPCIKIVLSGSDPVNSGVSLRLKLQGFKIAGDKGKRIPKLALEEIKVTMVINVVIISHYNTKRNKWEISASENFKIQILSFKGPFGISRNFVRTILSLVIPMIRRSILDALPKELGQLIKTLQQPFSINGDFDVIGIELHFLENPLERNIDICTLCGYTPKQMDVFQWMQRSIGKNKRICNLSDIILYKKMMAKHPKHGQTLSNLWDEVCRIYCEKIISLKSNQAADHDLPFLTPNEYIIQFELFLIISEDIERKNCLINLKIQNIDGQFSINEILLHCYSLFKRNCTENLPKFTGLLLLKLKQVIDLLDENYTLGIKAIKMMTENLDFAQLKIFGEINSGPLGNILMIVKDFYAQAPLNLNLNLSKTFRFNLLARELVPLIFIAGPIDETGEILFEINSTYDDIELINWQDKKVDNIEINRISSNDSNNSNNSLYSHSIDTNEVITVSKNSRRNNVDSICEVLESCRDVEEDRKQYGYNLLSVQATTPHMSLVADSNISLNTGAVLLKVAVGHETEYKPPSKGEEIQQQDCTEVESTSSLPKLPIDTKKETSNFTDKLFGCPVRIHTGNNIKMLIEEPKAEITIPLFHLLRVIATHFVDLKKLRKYLFDEFKIEFYEEYLVIGQVLLDRISKYILLPGLDININLYIGCVTAGDEVMVRLETPKAEEVKDLSPNKKDIRSSLSTVPNKRMSLSNLKAINDSNYAIKFRFQLNLVDIINDINTINVAVEKAYEFTKEMMKSSDESNNEANEINKNDDSKEESKSIDKINETSKLDTENKLKSISEVLDSKLKTIRESFNESNDI
jgi:hypothetical protein